MNLQKIISYINNLLKNKSSNNINKRRNNWDLSTKINKWKKIILNKINKKDFIKKRKQLTIKKVNLWKLRVFWNNIFHYYILYIIIFIWIIWYITFWPTFKINIINIIKQEDITNVEIAYKATDKYRWKSIFSVNKKDILNQLQNYQHNIQDIKTNIVLPNKLNISINSFKWIFNTTINNKSFIITENGTLIPKMYSEELMELIVKNKFDENKFLDYKKNFETQYIKKIYQIITFLKENIVWLKIKDVKYYVIEREVHIKTDNDTIIIFDLNLNPKEQIEKISVFNKDHININKKSIIYIDLRIKNKVFYCTNEDEHICIRNLKSIYPDG